MLGSRNRSGSLSTNHLDGKVAVITGAGSGFGRLLSERAASMGARVVCADVDAESLDATVDAIRANNGHATAQVTDVTDLTQVQRLQEHAVASYAGVDILVNNAGTMPLAFYSDHAAAYTAWSRCIDVNIKGVLHGMMAVHDHMIERGRGHIVNLSSIYSNFPVAGAGVYGATKAAVNFLSEAMRVESQGKIKVTVVKPTGVPGTNLSGGVINPEAVVGILGQHAMSYGATMQAYAQNALEPAATDPEQIDYVVLEPEYLVEQILHAINQPWGVVVGDITVRASGEGYVL